MAMEEKKQLAIAVASGTGIALALGGLLYMQSGSLDTKRQRIEDLESQIARDRALVRTTPEVEHEVILARETDEIIATILPNDDEILNFVRTLRDFEQDSGVVISSIRDTTPGTSKKTKDKEDFQRVAYNIQFEADGFEMLTFLDLIESHQRFMRVPSFKLRAAKRGSGEDGVSQADHSVQMEVETYVYSPQSGIKAVEIDNYDRKRDRLAGAIAARERELQIPAYEYMGSGNRRDPWVDPRLSVNEPTRVPIPEQLELVDALEIRVDTAEELLQAWENAPNLIAEMKARRALEEHLALLEVDARRLEQEGSLSFVSAEQRFRSRVLERMVEIRSVLDEVDDELLPVEVLRSTVESMQTHMAAGEYGMALEAYRNVEPRLEIAGIDEFRRPLVDRIDDLRKKTETVIDFGQLELVVNGVVDLGPGQRVALINGDAFSPNDLVGSDLILYAVRDGELDFIFRGVLLTLPF
ncbi:hypothetical protein [Engelhardtia mirabilis]|uniref:Uncharacterized protein n=1 Tax=Engelhardtia mirabilis TaxID=2528011 RepID=A0A518BP97_9BACT|nr:hypothetical protein Pla133_39030 [Planctomycetes bacterium Pla133]QDV03127.1 hypothetical protein Pla86_39020 [Planctomycetes bacterium Pla86]